jgi:hypothetical protein
VPRFALKDGEQILERALAEHPVDGVLRGARLIVTDRRIVLIPDSKTTAWHMFGALGGLLGRLLDKSTDAIGHQMARDELGTVEARDDGTLWIRSKGEGYGMHHFEIKISKPAAWAAKLTAWAAGN